MNLAARHIDGRWAIIYLASPTSFSIRMAKFAAGSRIDAFWIDPGTGERASIGHFSPVGEKSFATPDGWEDALLILEATAQAP